MRSVALSAFYEMLELASKQYTRVGTESTDMYAVVREAKVSQRL
jgi:hypothetical protein